MTLSNVARSAPCPTRGALTPHREPQLRWSRAWRQEARGWEQSAGVAALTRLPVSSLLGTTPRVTHLPPVRSLPSSVGRAVSARGSHRRRRVPEGTRRWGPGSMDRQWPRGGAAAPGPLWVEQGGAGLWAAEGSPEKGGRSEGQQLRRGRRLQASGEPSPAVRRFLPSRLGGAFLHSALLLTVGVELRSRGQHPSVCVPR